MVICTLSVTQMNFPNKMKKDRTVLIEFCKIVLDVEKHRRLVVRCECCQSFFSSHLYVIKTQIYGIYHVCENCKCLLEENPADGLVTFILKFA